MDSAMREEKPSKLDLPIKEVILSAAVKDAQLVLGTANGKLIILDINLN